MPAQFIEVAERSGLIAEISEWVWRRRRVRRRNGVGRLAGRAYRDQRLAAAITGCNLSCAAEETLIKYALPPHCLEIELTETALQTGAATIDALHWLRSIGVCIALDDFGTGYSSLTSLQQLPLTRVKLDRSLIQDVDENPRSASIVRSIIGLCRSLGLSITVEGIERRAQLALLQAHAPVNVQGYLICQAVPIPDITAFIHEREYLPA